MKAKAGQQRDPTKHKYIDSPLGQFLDALLKKIDEQKQKYPLTANSPVELRYSHRLLDAAMDVLTRVHSAIWWNFCSGGHPGATTIFVLIKDAWSLSKYKDLFTDRTELFYQELESCISKAIKTAVSMEGDHSTNVIKILKANQSKYFAITLEVPGVNIEEYFTCLTPIVTRQVGRLKRDCSNLDFVTSQILYFGKDQIKAIDRKSGLSADIDELDLNPYRIFYDLIELALIHYNSFPRQFNELIPFFDPKSLNLDLHNGYLVGPGLRALTGASFIFEHAQKKDSQIYKFITYEPIEPKKEGESKQEALSDKEVKEEGPYCIEEQEFEIDPHYEEHFDKALAGILGIMMLFYLKTVLNQDVQIKLDENKLLQDMLKESSRQIQSWLPNIDLGDDCLIKVRQLEGLGQIAEIQRMLSECKGFVAAYDKLKMTVEIPAQFICNVYFAVTKKTIQQKELVPSQLLRRIEGVGVPFIIPLVERGFEEISQTLSDNNEKYDRNTAMIKTLEDQLKTAIINFRKTKRVNCAENLYCSLKLVKQYRQRLDLVMGKMNNNEEPSKDFKELERDLAAVTEVYNKLISLKDLAASLLSDVRKISTVDAEFRQFDKDEKLQAELTKMVSKGIEDIESCKAAIDEAVSLIKEKKLNVETAFAEAKFIEEMRSASPQKMGELIKQREDNIQEHRAELTKLDGQLADTKKYNALLQEAIQLVSKYAKLPEDVFRDLESEKEAAVRWMDSQIQMLDSLCENIFSGKEFPGYFLDIIAKLGFVKRGLQVWDGEVLFQKIDEIPSFRSIDDKASCGFDKCLTILGVAPGFRKSLTEFRSRNEGLLSFVSGPSEQEVKDTRSVLFSLVCGKIDECQAAIAQGTAIPDDKPRFVEIKDLISVIDLQNTEYALTTRIAELALEKEKLEYGIPVIQEFIKIQIEIKKCADLIERFNGEGDFLSNCLLYQHTPKLYAEQYRLEKMVEEFKGMISNTKYPLDNEQYLKAISSLVGFTGTRISRIIQSKFVSTINDFISSRKDFGEQFESIQAELRLLSKIPGQGKARSQESNNSTLAFDLDEMSVDDLNRLITANDDLIKSITARLAEIEKLKVSTSHLRGDYTQQVETWFKDLTVLKESASTTLSHLKRLLLSSTQFQILDRYIKEREERYYVKDAFYDDDAIDRRIFVNELKQKLNEFSSSGDIANVVEHIRKNAPLFPGTHLTSVLSRMICMLMDYDDQLDVDVSRKPDFELLSVNTILGDLSKSNNEAHKEYVRKMKFLYGRIQDMEDYSSSLSDKYSPEVKALATNLRKTVDQFVLSRPEDNADQELMFENFNVRLTAVLHSKDDLLCELGYGFWRVVLNIGLALSTFLIQPICNKIAYGQFGFFAKNYVQECCDRVTRTMDELHPISASPAA